MLLSRHLWAGSWCVSFFSVLPRENGLVCRLLHLHEISHRNLWLPSSIIALQTPSEVWPDFHSRKLARNLNRNMPSPLLWLMHGNTKPRTLPRHWSCWWRGWIIFACNHASDLSILLTKHICLQLYTHSLYPPVRSYFLTKQFQDALS